MSPTLSWINVLNEETQWQGAAAQRQWLAALFGYDLDLPDTELDEFEVCIAQMRCTIDSLHFGGVPNLEWLDQQLAEVKLTVRHEPFLPQSMRPALPRLHAQVQSLSDHDLLKAVGQTLLIQFAQFVDRALNDDQAPPIARCEGLYRDSAYSKLSMVRSIPDDSEKKWRAEIEILRQNDLMNTTTVQRCADIFVAGPKARFCSDACRFTTFQLAKQLKDPRYQADKQKKYRSKLSDKE